MSDRKDYLLQYKKDNYKRIPLDVTIEKYNQIKKHSEDMHETVNGFIKRAIDEAMENDKK